MKIHRKYMERSLQIAKLGLGTVAPNPMVGCVVVYKDVIIGEGFTSPFGGNHAEVNAILSVKDKSALKHSTLYVSLEPCSHYGKTPPCTDFIIKHKIPKVVIGCKDPNVLVSGKGIEGLKTAGVLVEVGVMEEECRNHHKRFLTYQKKKRPYVILKWAQSSNGFLAPNSKDKKEPVWLSNQYSRQIVHKWRSEEQSILVGTQTVEDDNPSLTTRDWKGSNSIRVVLDRQSRLKSKSEVFNDESRTIVITSDKKNVNSTNQVSFETIDWQQDIANQILKILYKNDVTSVIVEGGAKTLKTFIEENLWDEARIFTGTISLAVGIAAPLITGKTKLQTKILTDTLTILVNDKDPNL